MDNLDLKQKALLELSGELPRSARKEFLSQISNDPVACREYETVRNDFALLTVLPIHEPSAAQRKLIPTQIKTALQSALRPPQKRARATRVLMRCAAAALIAGVAGIFAWTSWSSSQAASRQSVEQIARINAATDRVLPPGHKPGPYEFALNDVEASIRQLETESPTLSSVYDKNLANLLDALASVPQVDETAEWYGDEIPLP